MSDKQPKDKKPEAAAPAAGAPEKTKKEKVSIDPAQRKKGGFDRAILKGKAPIFRTMKKSGR